MFVNINQHIEIKNSSIEDFFLNLQPRDLIIYSPTSVSKINIEIGKLNSISTHHFDNKEDIEKAITSFSSPVRRVIAVGAGKAMDIAKYISARLNCEVILIPAVFSVNSPFTDKSCLFINGEKTTVASKLPDVVLVYPEYITRSEKIYNILGLFEILAFHTALKDWDIAVKSNGEERNEIIYETGKNSLKQLLKEFDSILENFDQNLYKLIELLIVSGYVTKIFGSGRPESGSEHIFSKKLEEITNVRHGISVAIGIIAMSFLQNNYSKEVERIITNPIIKEEIKKSVTKQEIENALFCLRPRRDRFTILNIKKLQKKELLAIMQKLESLIYE